MTPEELKANMYAEIDRRLVTPKKLDDWNTTKESVMTQVLEGLSASIITADIVNSADIRKKINEIIPVINKLINDIIPLIIPLNDDKRYILDEYMRELKNELTVYGSTFPYIGQL